MLALKISLRYWWEENAGWRLLKNQKRFDSQYWLRGELYDSMKALLRAIKENKAQHPKDAKRLFDVLNAAISLIPWREVVEMLNEAFQQQKVQGAVLRVYPFGGHGPTRSGCDLWKIVVSRDDRTIDLYLTGLLLGPGLPPGLLVARIVCDKLTLWRVQSEDLFS